MYLPYPLHPNGMCFTALDAQGHAIATREYYSVGGGFVIDTAGERVLNTAANAQPDAAGHGQGLPHPFRTGAELLAQCKATGLTMAQLMAANEQHWRSAAEVRRQLMAIWHTMAGAVQRGCAATGTLPGPCMYAAALPSCTKTSAATPRPRCATRSPCSTG